jgi:uncharacterized protein (DUF58 family)
MASRRFFVGLALAALPFVAGAAVEPMLAVGIVVDIALLAALWFDHRLARAAGIEGARSWPQLLVQGVPTTVTLDVTNRETRPVRVLFRDGLHPALADAPERGDMTIRASGRATWTFEITPRHRGVLEVLPVTIRILGPLGLAWAQRQLVSPESRRVYPQVRWQGKVGHLLVLAQRHELGRVRTEFRGQGSEPYALREYRIGDPLRSVHWKATARHGRPIVKEEVLERFGRLIILLDCGRSMTSIDNQRSKLDHALASALAVMRIAVARGDRVAVAAFDTRIRRVVRVHGGSRGVAAAYRSLFDLEARMVEPAYDLASELVGALGRRRSTVIVFTSVVDLAAAELLTDALQRLRRRHQPLLVNLEDAELGRLAHGRPRDPAEAFAKVASLQILLANRQLAKRLRRSGVWAIAAQADQLALSAVEGYLAMTRRL